MFFKIQPIIYSLIFLAALESLIFKGEWLLGVILFLLIFLILVVWPFLRKITFLSICTLYIFGVMGMLSLVTSKIEKQIFLVGSALIFYLVLLGLHRLRFYCADQTAQGMVNFAILAGAFGWFVTGYGFYLNYAIDAWVLLLASMGLIFFISLPSFCICSLSRQRLERSGEIEDERAFFRIDDLKNCSFEIVFISVILSLVMTEVIWGVLYWPFGQLTTGAVALIIFYVFWDTARGLFIGKMNYRRIIFQAIAGAILIGGLLYSAQWRLVV